MMDVDEQRRIEWACRATAAAIVFHLDRADFAAMVRHYTEDVVFVRLGEELVGRGAILAAMAQRPVVVTRHLHTTTHFVDVQPGEAEAFIYNVTYAGPVPATPGATSPMSAHPHIFEFHDRYRKVGDDWQVARREAVMVFKPGP